MALQRDRPSRVFLLRHGQTQWSVLGRLTGKTEIRLTKEGEEEVVRQAREKVGVGKLIDPGKLARVYVSPRERARRTCELFLGEDISKSPKYIQSDNVDEWDHGDYEGKTTEEIQAIAAQTTSDKPWSIWTHGCKNGEQVEEVQKRVRTIVNEIKHAQMEGSDIIVVAHGTILRCFIACWLEQSTFELCSRLDMPTATVVTLSYKSNGMTTLHLGND